MSDGMEVTYEFMNGTGARYMDQIVLGNVTLIQCFFGALDHLANGDLNYFGLGFPETSFGSGEPVYNTLQLLKGSTVINSASASIKLRDPGALLFGGVDQSAYYGDIVSLPMQQDAQTGKYESFAVSLEEMSITDPAVKWTSKGTSALPISVLMDTGSFACKLPTVLVGQIWDTLKIEQNVTLPSPLKPVQYGLVPCSLNKTDIKVNFEFMGFKIDIPIAEFVLNASNSFLVDLHISGLPPGMCLFAIVPNPDIEKYPMSLGSSFLQNVYLVIDQDSFQIGLAKVNNIPLTPDIREIAPGLLGPSNINNTVLPAAATSAAPTAAVTTATSVTASSTSAVSTTPAAAKNLSHTKSHTLVALLIALLCSILLV